MTTQDEQQKCPSPVHMSPQSHGACAAAAASAIASPTKCALRGFPSHMLMAACVCMPILFQCKTLNLQSSVPCCTLATTQRSDPETASYHDQVCCNHLQCMHPPLVPAGARLPSNTTQKGKIGSKCASGNHVQRG